MSTLSGMFHSGCLAVFEAGYSALRMVVKVLDVNEDVCVLDINHGERQRHLNPIYIERRRLCGDMIAVYKIQNKRRVYYN